SFAAASGWTGKRGGASFAFDPRDDTALAASAGGITSMRIRFKPGSSHAKIRLKLADTDLPYLQGRDVMDVQILIGDSINGDCGTTTNLSCDGSEARLSCP